MDTILCRKFVFFVFSLIWLNGTTPFALAQSIDPLRILMITGGGPWHDYATQKDQIVNGLQQRLSNVEITTDYEGAENVDYGVNRFSVYPSLEVGLGGGFRCCHL